MGTGSHQVIKVTGHLRGKISGKNIVVSDTVVAETEKILGEISQEFDINFHQEITKLELSYESLVKTKKRDVLAQIMGQLEHLKESGLQFGYPLITQICQSLIYFLDHFPKNAAPDLLTLKAHIDSVRAVYSDQLMDADSPLAKRLIDSLKTLVQKRLALQENDN